MTAAQQLRDWIDRRGFNQVEAADRLGMTEGFISFLLNGHRRPSLAMAVKIEESTGIPASAWVKSARHTSKKARKHSTEIASVNGV